jgi:hypothetical protein
MEGDYALGGEVLARTRQPSPGAGHHRAQCRHADTIRRVLVPTTGASFSRLDATVATLYANATSADITGLYVKESPMVSLRNFYPRRAENTANTTPITSEIRAFGQQLGINIEARTTSRSKLRTTLAPVYTTATVEVLYARATERSHDSSPDHRDTED